MDTVLTEKVKRVNDKGERIPEKCPKCGSKIGLFIKGEPVWLCSNKDCNKYYGTLPFTESYQERTERNTMYDNILSNMMNEFFGESGDNSIPDLIEPVVKTLESKGYQVKYASPGHENTRFDNDRDKDRVINSKFASTGRIIFSRNYDFPSTPQGWTWKVLENGAKALYTKPYTYNEKQGTEKEAFIKWQTFYIDSVKNWANDLPKAGSGKEPTHPDTNFSK